MNEGFIYIIENLAFPGFYKFGITQDIKKRIQPYQTGDPERRYKIVFF